MTSYRYIEPIDVLFLRGNRLFGDAGQHGEATMPPWPSVFSGAVASLALATSGNVSKVTAEPDKAENILNNALGPDFGLTFQALAKGGDVYLPLPADLVVTAAGESLKTSVIDPLPGGTFNSFGLRSSSPSAFLPVLASADRNKPETGIWMSLGSWRKHLSGQVPLQTDYIRASALWDEDQRLGIALSASSRIAEEGRIYTGEAVALHPGVRFVCGFAGENIPESGALRLGGDGRGAEIARAGDPVNDLGNPGSGWSGFRMILTSPGVFPNGWLPPFVELENGRLLLRYGGLEAELVAAAVSRHEVISGWDMAHHRPKPAQKVVPAGSVYWFHVEKGDTAALLDLWSAGLLSKPDQNLVDPALWRARRREGFGRVWFGQWNPIKEGRE